MQLRARPTTYRGVAMRSRLEASVAQYLDEIGFDWDYEPRAYGGTGGQYLPDFVLYGRGLNRDETHVWEVRPTVEAAFSALTEMLVIWESEPGWRLCVVIPGVGLWQNKSTFRRPGWRWIAFAEIGVPVGAAA
jgi:hypothetical protein